VTFKVKDYYFKKAKKEDYLARSIYKLEEIDKKFKIFKRGIRVLDLGAAPGSWVQYILKAVGKEGEIFAVDISPMATQLAKEINFINKSVFDLTNEDLNEKSFHVITSDMAPSTTGIRDVDQEASFELVQKAFGLCKSFLMPHGHFVCKVFQGASFDKWLKDVKPFFRDFKLLKPQGTRKESKEIYIVGKEFLGHKSS
jgi:23S rRNA (uridine2552-2'-O)-methyltransferase